MGSMFTNTTQLKRKGLGLEPMHFEAPETAEQEKGGKMPRCYHNTISLQSFQLSETIPKLYVTFYHFYAYDCLLMGNVNPLQFTADFTSVAAFP